MTKMMVDDSATRSTWSTKELVEHVLQFLVLSWVQECVQTSGSDVVYGENSIRWGCCHCEH